MYKNSVYNRHFVYNICSMLHIKLYYNSNENMMLNRSETYSIDNRPFMDNDNPGDQVQCTFDFLIRLAQVVFSFFMNQTAFLVLLRQKRIYVWYWNQFMSCNASLCTDTYCNKNMTSVLSLHDSTQLNKNEMNPLVSNWRNERPI